MIETDLFEFAYVPDWYGQLEQLAEMALPEAWRFRKPQTECKNRYADFGTVSPYDIPEAEHRLQHRRNGVFPCGK